VLPSWPYLTKSFSGIPGEIKAYPEDFIVEEIPAYEASGEGDHTYFLVEKRGVTTLDMIRRLARALGRSERDFGYAGLKDSRAITRQMVSLEHADEKQIASLELDGIKIISINRHSNKIKLGHLSGNKFWIKLRNTVSNAKAASEPCLKMLAERGVPNYFGVQRFGIRGDSWILGRSILHEDYKEFMAQLCGRPADFEKDHIRKARELYDKGMYELAGQVWPGFFRDAKRCCKILAGNPEGHFKAFTTVDRKLIKLFLSAYQSYLFNEVMAKRIDTLDKIIPGDLAAREDNGAVFRVEDVAVEQDRADRFEISPTGPIYGYRMMEAGGAEKEIEDSILKEERITLEDFKKPKGLKLRGSRRTFRVRMYNLEVDEGSDVNGAYLYLRFDLPSGSYATAVLRELMKEYFEPQSGILSE
jgi:tRNA pseudouridine13 synthase